MTKTLRSMIHEVFPPELRVDIDLLSRRRDISNKEKQEEIFALLRKYKIDNIVPLGSGTNRYAFKLNGFVVKVATDHDGKIDNLKEFKMAKRLFPHVVKVYEVAENGTLLICEYIQPFQSYGEMLKYESQIKEILTQLSSVYLIGDVGITKKNYSNWGLRIGDDKPVCLDFAYVYEVNSELFLCGYCKSNSMLLPTSDFTELYCPNPACGRKYTFEDIRARLGNDIHRHEIGDLSEEGYKMLSSNVITELTDSRSNYLVKKKKVDEVHHEDISIEEIKDTFCVLDDTHTYTTNNNLEDKTMRTIKASTVIIGSMGNRSFGAGNVRITKIPAPVQEEIPADEVVFSMDVDTKSKTNPTINDDIPDAEVDLDIYGDRPDDTSDFINNPAETIMFSEPVVPKEIIVDDAPAEETHVEEQTTVIPAVVVTKEVPVTKVETKVEPKQEKKVETPKKEIRQAKVNKGPATVSDTNFDNIMDGVSKISFFVGRWVDETNLFEEVQGDIKGKQFKSAKDLSNDVNRAVYLTIADFCKFKKTTEDVNGRTITKYNPTELAGTSYEPTLVFINRWYNSPAVYHEETVSDMLAKYRKLFNNYTGFQSELKPILRKKLNYKLNWLQPIGIDIIYNAIIASWIVLAEETHTPDPTPEPDEKAKVAVSEEGVVKAAEEVTTGNSTEVATDEVVTETSTTEETPHEEEVDEELQEAYDYADKALEEAEADDYEEEVDDLSIEVYHTPLYDCVKIRTADELGEVIYPIYYKEDSLNMDALPKSMTDDRNGIWDFLSYFMPDKRFITTNPDKWLKLNDSTELDNTFKFVILDEDDEANVLMGIYPVGNIIYFDKDNEPVDTDKHIIALINQLVADDMETSSNHLWISIDDNEDICTEEYIEALTANYDNSDEDSSEDVDDTSESSVEEDLAKVLTGETSDADDATEKFLEHMRERLPEVTPKKELEHERVNDMVFAPRHRTM